MLDFKDVVFQFPVEKKPIIDHLSFHVNRGEFISIIGASGCGKSTIFRLINRLLVPEKGEILVAGRRVAGKPAADSGKEKSPEKPRDKTRGNIPVCGYMPQQDLLFPWRTVEENICLPMELQGGISREEQHRRAQKALKDVGAFARTLLTGAELLLLDEPFSALDYLTRIEMREWLLEQWERERKTVLFITHDVEEAIFLSGRVLVAERSPITSLTSVEIPLGVPRSIEDLKKPEIQDMKEQLIGKLRNTEIDLPLKAGV